MAAPSMVFTGRYAALRLCVDLIEELAEQMSPEDGCFSIIDSLDETAESVIAFTPWGLDRLNEMLDERRSQLI
ncbi:hypothetical protein [Sphingomonas sp. PAMC 26605]|uniref:hypothetical protein n=1 Tax=Sphingomonas sp. PAMC 26605 TaxID=1112214 RepID=UPI00026CCBC1|nr:hypothetical protein [Sphingomonas sp. PAMC 26605]